LEKLLKEDFEKLNNDFIYIAKKRFDVDLKNDPTGVFISDVLISLYFEGKRISSKIVISLVGSYIGQTVIINWGGFWVPDKLSIRSVGKNGIVVNPFSIAHQRLTKGINKMLYSQLENVAFKCQRELIDIDDNVVKDVFNYLYSKGFWPISKIEQSGLPNYVRYEMAYVAGIMSKYLEHKDYIEKTFEDLINNKNTTYYALVALQNNLIHKFLDKIVNIIQDNGYPKNVKAQAILSLTGWVDNENMEGWITSLAHKLFYEIYDPVLKIYLGQLLGTINSYDNIKWINQNLLDKKLDDYSKLSLLVAVQLLRNKEFNKTLLSLFFDPLLSNTVKDEIMKTFHLLPLNEEIKSLENSYDNFDMKNKINFVDVVLFSNNGNKKEILNRLLSKEKDNFVRSYILSALDSIEEIDDSSNV